MTFDQVSVRRPEEVRAELGSVVTRDDAKRNELVQEVPSLRADCNLDELDEAARLTDVSGSQGRDGDSQELKELELFEVSVRKGFDPEKVIPPPPIENSNFMFR